MESNAGPWTPWGEDGARDRSDRTLDLDAVERELHEVEDALAKLDDGTYWDDPTAATADVPHAVEEPPR